MTAGHPVIYSLHKLKGKDYIVNMSQLDALSMAEHHRELQRQADRYRQNRQHREEAMQRDPAPAARSTHKTVMLLAGMLKPVAQEQ
jgi:hypothetical protein